MLFALVAILGFGTSGFLGKMAAREQMSWEFFQMFTVLGNLMIGVLFRPTPSEWLDVRRNKTGFGLALLAGIAGFVGGITLYLAYKTVDVSIVVPLSSLYVVITVLLALVFLRERLSLAQGVGVALAVAAAILFSVGGSP
jgi:transporter family protein